MDADGTAEIYQGAPADKSATFSLYTKANTQLVAVHMFAVQRKYHL